jgi:hypothetical protein
MGFLRAHAAEGTRYPAALTRPGPFLCYLTHRRPRPRTRPPHRHPAPRPDHAAIRTAAEGRQTTYHATGSTITIGIRAMTPKNASASSRRALDALIIKHGLTIRDQPPAAHGSLALISGRIVPRPGSPHHRYPELW